MPRFQYKAMAADGELVEGEVVALDHAAAIKQIQALGHIPISAEELHAGEVDKMLRKPGDIATSRRLASRLTYIANF